MLRRRIEGALAEWRKDLASRKALFVTGSRQIGKSFSIREFAKRSYSTLIEINLMEDVRAKDALASAENAGDAALRQEH